MKILIHLFVTTNLCCFLEYPSAHQGICSCCFLSETMKSVKQWSWLTRGFISHSKIPRNVVHVGVHSTRMTFPKAPTNISLTVISRWAGLGFHGE